MFTTKKTINVLFLAISTLHYNSIYTVMFENVRSNKPITLDVLHGDKTHHTYKTLAPREAVRVLDFTFFKVTDPESNKTDVFAWQGTPMGQNSSTVKYHSIPRNVPIGATDVIRINRAGLLVRGKFFYAKVNNQDLSNYSNESEA